MIKIFDIMIPYTGLDNVPGSQYDLKRQHIIIKVFFARDNDIIECNEECRYTNYEEDVNTLDLFLMKLMGWS